MDEKTNTNMNLLLQELQGGKADDSPHIKELFYLCLAKWRWFALSVLLCTGLAVFYILRTPPVYTRSAYLMVKENAKGHSIGSDISSLFADLGLAQVNANVNNELLALQMPSVVMEMVKRLSLDVDYRTGDMFHRNTLYGAELPIETEFLELGDNESAGFTLRLLPEGKVELDDFGSTERDVKDKAVTGMLGDTLDTPLGQIKVMPGAGYVPGEEYPLIYVSRTGLYDCVDGCNERLAVELSSEDATVIELSYKDVSVTRAEDVLNTLIAVYNEEWMKDKNQITATTSQFITDRLEVLERELGNVDTDISTYKSENLLPDAEKASLLFMEQAQENNNKLIAISTQAAIAKYIRDYLSGGKMRNRLVPANLGLENTDIEGLIAEYNDVQLRRNNLITNSSDQNPLIADLDQSLAAMRGSIISSIDNLLVSLDTQRIELLRSERQTTAKIAVNPEQTKYLQTVGRQQKVKEALYLFLLQKREENELSQAFTPYNMRILTPPSGNMEPVAPRKWLLLLAAFCIGIFIPLLLIYIRESMSTTVRTRKDLGKLTIPFVGEIPLHLDSKGRKSLFRKVFRPSKKKQSGQKQIVVKEGKRDIVNEAIRVLRTNLEFMTEGGAEVTLLTSYNPDSGKTFLTVNIAASLAIKGKKVLVIDGDLRHGSLSEYAGTPVLGLSDYLAGRVVSWRDIVRKVDENFKSLDIIPVGTVPPNPSELLFGERLQQLVTEIRHGYDYIFIDCPPVDIVADTQIIGKVADRTLFVVRAGLLERNMLPELEELYRQRKFKNMAVVLNGTEPEAGRYDRYGYKYGYRYGYANENKKN